MSLTREAVLEAGRVRFEKNFGGPRCDTCDGLKAGPGVIATCFQMRQCFFTNIKATDKTQRQDRLIDFLTKGSNRP